MIVFPFPQESIYDTGNVLAVFFHFLLSEAVYLFQRFQRYYFLVDYLYEMAVFGNNKGRDTFLFGSFLPPAAQLFITKPSC